MINKGTFIVFEGGEGTGKTTQAKILQDQLNTNNILTILTREPGGTKESEEIRKILINGEINKWDGISETLLHYAARREHIKKKIIPELKKGTWIICDRFFHSTEAYQGAGYGVSADFLNTLKKAVCEDLVPDITFIFDQKVEKSIQRIKDRNENNRYENFDINFHNRVRKYFKNLKNTTNNNCILINTDDTIENISDKILLYVQQNFIQS